MKKTPSNCAFTRVELIVLGGILAILVFMFFFALQGAQVIANRNNCSYHLKQIALSFRLWAGDNDERMPMQVPINWGGTMELVEGGTVTPHFLIMSNELESPNVLTCPGNPRARPAVGWTGLTDANITYFVIPEADESIPRMILSGDSNLTTNQIALTTKLFTVETNSNLGWTSKHHRHGGNIVVSDGSVEQVYKDFQTTVTNALRAYYDATTNTSFRIAIP